MKIRVSHNASRFERQIASIVHQQMPRALYATANATAADVRTNTLKRIRRRFHKPVPYMQKTSVFLLRAFPGRRFAMVGIKDHQASMYGWQEHGGRKVARRRRHSGSRGGEGRMIPVPIKIDRNARDNMAFKAIPRVLRRKDTFQAGKREGLKPGIYRREKANPENLDLLVRFRRSVRYERRFDWRDMAKKTVAARLRINFERAVAREIHRSLIR